MAFESGDRVGSEQPGLDLAREGGPAALDQPLTEIMTRKVATCSQSDTISSIMERMTDGKFRHVPVVEQGRLAGIISIGDVVKYWRTILRSGIIGTFIGIVPGVGEDVASWSSYAAARRASASVEALICAEPSLSPV